MRKNNRGRKAVLLVFSSLLIYSHYALIQVAKAEQPRVKNVALSEDNLNELLGVKQRYPQKEDWRDVCAVVSEQIEDIQPNKAKAKEEIELAFKDVATMELRQPLLFTSSEDKKDLKNELDVGKDKLLDLKGQHDKWIKEEEKKAEERRKAKEEAEARKKRELEEKAKEEANKGKTQHDGSVAHHSGYGVVENESNPQTRTQPAPAKKHQQFCVDELCYTYTETYSEDLGHLQALIDQGRVVAKGGFAKNNRSTYLLGHNPGIMSGVAGRLHIGKEIYMHDANGVAHKYRIHSRVSTDIYGNYNGERQYVYPGVTPSSALYDGVNEDVVYIQYCFYENGGYDNSYVWVALPA